jgi:ABC-type transport system substrate-binding protein/class 3 adenylate cyclase
VDVSEGLDPEVGEAGGAPGAAEKAAPHTDLRTFMIADIRGYTTYTREHGDEAAAALAGQFGDIVAEVVPRHEGFLVELRGDEALVVFVSARKALRAAVELQDRFGSLPRGVGIGLDAGEAIPVGAGYRGTALNLAARLSGQAAAGETLASEAVIHLAAKMDGISYVDARDLKLKGYAEAVRAVVVLPSDRAKGHRLASDRRSPNRASKFVVAVAIVLVLALIGTAVGAILVNRNDLANVAATPTRPGQSSGPSSSLTTPPTPSSSPDLLGDTRTPVLAFFDASSGIRQGTTPLESPRNISFFAGGAFWILTENPNAFHKIDPVTHKEVKRIQVPPMEPHGFNWDDEYIWVTDLGAPVVWRIDQISGTWTNFNFAADESDDTPAGDVAIGDGSVWLSRDQRDPPEITRIDRLTGHVDARIDEHAFGLSYGADALWYWREGLLGRIDPTTNEPSFDSMVELSHDEFLGNIYFAGGDAWTDSTGTGKVYRVDSHGRFRTYDLEPGIADMAPAADAMWVTNFNTGDLTGIDLVTGQHDRVIHTGHAVMAVASSGDQLMVAVGPTADEVVAGLPGLTLTMAANGIPWWDPAPDPPLAENWPAQQMLHLTCANLLTYPDAAGKDGLALIPEVAAGLPTVSADGRVYTFTIRPGFQFSPPSNEAVTAETFRYSIERTLNPIFDEDRLGPRTFADIVGAAEFRSGAASIVSGLVATDNQLQITLVAPAPDLLDRLASTVACPVPISGTPALRSGLKPFPPVSGAGPYYLAQTVGKRLAVFKKNPNYSGDRAQRFDNIAIHTQVAPATALGMVQRGKIDAVIFDPWDTLSGAGSALAEEWGPNGTHASAGDQRWFGAARSWVNYISLNPTGPTLRDPAVRHAVALAIDRADLAAVFIERPTNELLNPGVRGAEPLPTTPEPDLNAAQALLGGPVTVTMLGIPDEWDWQQGEEIEQAITRQLSRVGITVELRAGDPEDYFGHGVMDAGSDIDIVWNRSTGSDFSDPVRSLDDLQGVGWLGKANLDELTRLSTISGADRIAGAVALADRLVDQDYLIVPFSSPLNPFFVSARIGCAFVQPAYGAVDILSLCEKDAGAPAPPTASP